MSVFFDHTSYILTPVTSPPPAKVGRAPRVTRSPNSWLTKRQYIYIYTVVYSAIAFYINIYAGRTGGRASRRTNLFGRIGSRSRPGGMVARHRVPGADRERGRFGLDAVGAYVVVGARAGVEESAVREFLGAARDAERRGGPEVALLGGAHHGRNVVHVGRRVRVRLVHLRLQPERVLWRVFVHHFLGLFRVVVARRREVVDPRVLGPRVQRRGRRRVFPCKCIIVVISRVIYFMY